MPSFLYWSASIQVGFCQWMSIMTVLTRNLWSEMLGYPLDRERAPVHVQRGHATKLGGIVATDLVVSREETHLPALRLAPAKGGTGKRPAVLYCHAHGNRYDIGKAEIIDGRRALLDPPLGVALAEQGYIVLCVDMTGFGDRRKEGSEEALAKAALWQGRSLSGRHAGRSGDRPSGPVGHARCR